LQTRVPNIHTLIMSTLQLIWGTNIFRNSQIKITGNEKIELQVKLCRNNNEIEKHRLLRSKLLKREIIKVWLLQQFLQNIIICMFWELTMMKRVNRRLKVTFNLYLKIRISGLENMIQKYQTQKFNTRLQEQRENLKLMRIWSKQQIM